MYHNLMLHFKKCQYVIFHFEHSKHAYFSIFLKLNINLTFVNSWFTY